jgi:hypothetical protein
LLLITAETSETTEEPLKGRRKNLQDDQNFNSCGKISYSDGEKLSRASGGGHFTLLRKKAHCICVSKEWLHFGGLSVQFKLKTHGLLSVAFKELAL